MTNLYQEDLDFFEDAKQAFESEFRQVTHTNNDNSLIALRYGADNDCIRIYRLGDEVAFLNNVMKKCPVETVKIVREELGRNYLGDVEQDTSTPEWTKGIDLYDFNGFTIRSSYENWEISKRRLNKSPSFYMKAKKVGSEGNYGYSSFTLDEAKQLRDYLDEKIKYLES